MRGNTVTRGIYSSVTQDVYADPNVPPQPEDRYIGPADAAFQVVYQDSRYGDRTSPTPYLLSVVRETVPAGSLTLTRNYGFMRSTRTTSGPHNSYGFNGWRDLGTDDSYNAAVEKLYEQLRGSLDLSVALGETASTAKMFKAAAKLSRYILQIHPKHWANHWLEYKYGWSPLVSDVYAAIGEVNHVQAQLQRFKARATIRYSSEFSDLVSDGEVLKKVQQKESYRTEIRALFKPGEPAASTVARFASLNPASIVWELTPFSFVFDWFVDVGGYMRDLESSLIYSSGFVSGSITRTSKRTADTQVSGIGNSWGGRTMAGSLSGTRTELSLKRSTLDAAPRPQLPRFKPSLGASRLISAAALLKTVFLQPEKATPKRMKRTALAINRDLRRFRNGPRKWSLGAEL